MAEVVLNGVEKRYSETVVLQRLDVEIHDGEYLVLVGPSGCGKSTLLRSVAGLVDVTSGTISIGGRDVTNMSPRDRNVAMVFQSYALYPHMTVRDNLAFPLKIRKLPNDEIQSLVHDVAEQLELGALMDRFPAELSGGQRQRVAMGRAIVRRPSLFLFDEPLSNLDASLRTKMRVELKRLHKRLKTTVIHVTHDQIEAMTLADRILVLHEGVVQQLGSPRELFDRPENTFVATFIGSPSMNLLAAEGGDSLSFEGVEGRVAQGAPTGPITLGVRPSDVVVGEGDLQATVELIESMGATALIHMNLGKQSLRAEVEEPHGLVAGQTVSVSFSTIHPFDVKSGERIQ